MSPNRINAAIAGLALVLSLSPSLAAEQRKHRWIAPHHNHYARMHHRYGPSYGPGPYAAPSPYPGPYTGAQNPAYSEAPPSSGACVPLCRYDTSPCDPFYFKQADGRCSPAEHGGFF